MWYANSLEVILIDRNRVWPCQSGQSANTMPLWKREGSGEDLYIYSGLDGKWHVTWQRRDSETLEEAITLWIALYRLCIYSICVYVHCTPTCGYGRSAQLGPSHGCNYLDLKEHRNQDPNLLCFPCWLQSAKVGDQQAWPQMGRWERVPMSFQ